MTSSLKDGYPLLRTSLFNIVLLGVWNLFVANAAVECFVGNCQPLMWLQCESSATDQCLKWNQPVLFMICMALRTSWRAVKMMHLWSTVTYTNWIIHYFSCNLHCEYCYQQTIFSKISICCGDMLFLAYCSCAMLKHQIFPNPRCWYILKIPCFDENSLFHYEGLGGLSFI